MTLPGASLARAAGAAPRGGGARGLADMHIHSLYSDGTARIADILDHVERHTVLDVVAITDHERIDSAVRAAELHAAGDYFPSRDVEMLEYMELLAVFESSSRRLLPEKYAAMTPEELDRRMRVLRAAVGGRR